jgi:opacity protein-like surface antigen
MSMSRFGLATAALAATACLSAQVSAADLYGSSIKDPPVVMSSPGHCYIRGDVGYSWSRDPSERFTQTDPVLGFLTNRVTGTGLDNSWLVGAGLGCGSGSRGIRGELMFDWHGDRDLKGTLAAPLGGSLSTSVRTYTLMFNGYYDLGNYRGFVPYVGAGVGLAHNAMSSVSFSAFPNAILGEDRWSLAWSLMAGVGYQITDRMTVDFGYRYIDMGKAESGTIDTAGFTNPRVRFDDLTAHEFKVGIRFAFGGGEPCCAMMK